MKKDHVEPASHRVLVVDDNASIHEDFRKILCPHNGHSRAAVVSLAGDLFGEVAQNKLDGRFEMDSAFQGQEALPKVQQARDEGRPYALAFIDVRMPPGWDGVETVSRLWKVDPLLQVVICTAHSDHSRREMLEKLGPTDNLIVLKKPFDNIEAVQLAHTLTRKWSIAQALQVRLANLEDIVNTRTTELQAANAALALEKSFIKQIINASPNLISVKDHQGRLILVNQAMARLYRVTPESMLAKLDADFPPFSQDPNHAARAEHQVLAEGRTVTLEESLLDERGATRWYLTTKAPLRGPDGGTLVLSLSSDITEHKRIEEKRLTMNKLESTGILAGGIAHDFNNLLASTLLNVELARTMVDSTSEIQPHLDTILESTLAAQTLTKQLITFAKGGDPIRKPTPLNEIVSGSVMLALSGSSVKAEISLAKNLLRVDVDEGQIGQVLRNLLLNARDAMSNGGQVFIRAENVTCAPNNPLELPPGDYALVSVTDQGTGIAPDVLPRVFDPYFSTKRRGADKGMGLGLTICHSIVKKHGGAIVAESEPGAGATFKFYLPAIGKPASTPEKPPPPPQIHPPRSARILVMDDEYSMRLAVGSVLEQQGYQVELTSSGEEAIRLYTDAHAQGRAFDAVLLDLTVRGGIGGDEVIRELLKIDPKVKAVVMSGYSDSPALLDPARHGFKAGLVKSFDVQELTDSLALAMNSSVAVHVA